ncbi:hypothetical protein Pint_15132 [Pistacia integerrima]|uniref:Uncharacterized protein n=1 Tax=Pistacia integerrima TaxID=434235 RepID=A0ACC0Z8T1_9ROSI|nr:hypothetical protein Pint_15132 [Pistacia integerrima]
MHWHNSLHVPYILDHCRENPVPNTELGYPTGSGDSQTRSASPRASVSPVRGRRSRSLSRSRRSRSRSRSRDFVEATNPGNNLYVTGLSTRVTSSDLEKFFNSEGKVTECHLVTDPRTRESRGFAFVTMETVEDADRCIKYLNRTVLEGRLVTVEKVLVSDKGSYCAARQKGLVAEHQLLAVVCLSQLTSKDIILKMHMQGDLVADVLVATHLIDMTEILIQGNDGEDHAPHTVEVDRLPHMVEVDRVPHMRGGETIILTHIRDAENAHCLLVAVATQDRTDQFYCKAGPP